MNKVLVLAAAGSGMNVIIQYLLANNKTVYGSDRSFDKLSNKSVLYNILLAKGLNIIEENEDIETYKFDLIIKSAAIEDSHSSIIIAKRNKIKVISRSEFVVQLFNNTYGIGIAGTSGKSTVTGMAGYLLSESSLNPDVFSGAQIINWMTENNPGNFKKGQSESLILELDESDGYLEEYKSDIALITSIEKDHYPIAKLINMFAKFAAAADILIINIDQELTKQISLKHSNVITISGKDKSADYYYQDIQVFPDRLFFKLNNHNVQLNIAGEYNISNAAMAIALAEFCGVKKDSAIHRISGFRGVKNRFEINTINNNNFILDFAHNPEKIKASLISAQKIGKPVIYCFQPHGYGPLKFLKDEYVKILNDSLTEVDQLILLPVYDAGGTADRSVQSDIIIDSLSDNLKAEYFASRNDFLYYLRKSHFNNFTLVLSGARDESLRDLLKKIEQLFNDVK